MVNRLRWGRSHDKNLASNQNKRFFFLTQIKRLFEALSFLSRQNKFKYLSWWIGRMPVMFWNVCSWKYGYSRYKLIKNIHFRLSSLEIFLAHSNQLGSDSRWNSTMKFHRHHYFTNLSKRNFLCKLKTCSSYISHDLFLRKCPLKSIVVNKYPMIT